jgi:response regulator of citrate/malate metabolism
MTEVSEQEFRDLIWKALLRHTVWEIAEACGVSPASIRRYLLGLNYPMKALRPHIKARLEAL